MPTLSILPRGSWPCRPSMSCHEVAALNVAPVPWSCCHACPQGRKTIPEPARADAGIPLSRQITCHFIVSAVSTRLDSTRQQGKTDERLAGGRVSNKQP